MAEQLGFPQEPIIQRVDTLPLPNAAVSLTGVVDNLLGFDLLPLQLPEQLNANPHIDTVFVLGEPGVGKSTISKQLQIALQTKHGFEEVFYIGQDRFYQIKSAKFGKRPLEWTTLEQDEFSNDIEACIMETKEYMRQVAEMEKEEGKPAKRRLMVVDLNAIASQGNYGLTTVQNIVQRFPEETIVAAIVCDPRVQAISTIVRLKAQHIKDEEAEKFEEELKNIGKDLKKLAEESGINVDFGVDLDNVGIDVVFLDEKMRNASPRERSRYLLELARHAGDPKVMLERHRQLEKVMRNVSEESVQAYRRKFLNPIRRRRLAKAAGLSPESGEIDWVALETAHYDGLLGEFSSLGLPAEYAQLVYNLLRPDGVVWVP